MRTNNLVVISDLHAGCQTSLCPEKVELDGGGIYLSNPLQTAIMDVWRRFWAFVFGLIKREPFVLVVNGDAMDGRHHNATTQISQNLADQVRIAKAILQPYVEHDQCTAYYHIRGTEVHVGQSGENEETLAELLGAVPNSIGRYSRDELWIRIGEQSGALCHILHHIGTTGSMAYESTAVMKEMTESYIHAALSSNDSADCIIRSHRHACIQIEKYINNRRRVGVTTPSWQGKTPLAYKIAGARLKEPEWGGLLVREAPDGVWYSRPFSISPERSEIVDD